MEKILTVSIAAYNVEKYLGKFLESLALQTFCENIELIFVNDCTPDDSMSLVNDWKIKNNKFHIKIINHEKNKGLAAARNTALNVAKGKYIVFIDSDDWLEPDYLEQLYELAEKTDADIVGCDCFLETYRNTVIRKCFLCNTSELNIMNLLYGKTTGWLWVKLFKRDLFVQNNISWIEGIDLFEDVLIDVKLYDKSKKTEYTSIPLYHYNQLNLTSLTHELNDERCQQLINALKNIESYLISENKMDTYKKAYEVKQAYIKSWILRNCKNLRKEYLLLFKNKKLSKCNYLPFVRRFFLFLSEKNQYQAIFMLRIFLNKLARLRNRFKKAVGIYTS